MATSQYEPEENIADEEVQKFFTGSFASSKLTVINLTRIKLTVNNIFVEKRSPSKNNRLPAQPTCPWRATDRPTFLQVVHAAPPEEPTNRKAQKHDRRTN